MKKKNPPIDDLPLPVSGDDDRQLPGVDPESSSKREHEIKKIEEEYDLPREIAQRLVDEKGRS